MGEYAELDIAQAEMHDDDAFPLPPRPEKAHSPHATDLALVLDQTAIVSALTNGGLDGILDTIRRNVEAEPRDISTEAGRTAMRSFARNRIARSKTLIEEHAKALVAETKAKVKRVDDDRIRAAKVIDGLRDEFLAPLTEWEAKEKERKDEHERLLADLQENPAWGQTETAADIARRLDWLRNYPARDWQEFRIRFETAIAAEISRAEALLSAAERREAEAVELARLRQEAEAKARREAEEAERRAAAERQRLIDEAARREREAREAQERAARAERDRISAEQRAKEAAEAAARKAEQARIQAEVDAKRREQEAVEIALSRQAAAAETKRREDEARAADQEHRRTVNREVLADLATFGLPDDLAQSLIRFIVAGKVRHVSIRY